MMKRLFDLIVSFIGLVLTAPLLLVLALCVKLGSPGPALFRQERMGRDFRPFRINKFRTMVVDAPKRGAQITVGEDPRITRIGRFLRKTKLDELPHIQCLVGEMSSGPRPEVPKYVDLFHADYEEVFGSALALLTWLLGYRDESTLLGQAADPERMYVEVVLPDKIALAKQYIERSSLWYDLQIIARTVVEVAGSKRSADINA